MEARRPKLKETSGHHLKSLRRVLEFVNSHSKLIKFFL